MSSETDHPRQRTVAELLAEHGDAGATGRRRRRREADTSEDGATQAPPDGVGVVNGATAWPPSAPPAPDRSILRDPVPRQAVREAPSQRPFVVPEPAPDAGRPPLPPTRHGAGRPPGETTGSQPLAALAGRPTLDPARDRPTDQMPRIRAERSGVLDPGLTGPITQQPPPARTAPPEADETAEADEHVENGVDAGPATMVGVPPVGAEARRTRGASRRAADDGGPATQAAAPLDFDDHPAGLGGADDLDDLDALHEPAEDDDADAPAEAPGRRLGRGSAEASPGQAWAAVVAQWIVGAIGGAALWVGFRFLWRELPVVALAAAVLVTVGLVLVVRALLRNNDMRTTVFAVLVGLLLTVSPAILVLLGR
jgi:hypothetical protein